MELGTPTCGFTAAGPPWARRGPTSWAIIARLHSRPPIGPGLMNAKRRANRPQSAFDLQNGQGAASRSICREELEEAATVRANHYNSQDRCLRRQHGSSSRDHLHHTTQISDRDLCRGLAHNQVKLCEHDTTSSR